MKSSLKTKVIRTATVAMSLNYLLRGQLYFLNKYYEVVAVSGADDDLAQVSSREKVATIDVSMQRKISLLNDIQSLFRLYRLFKKEKPLIVHSITPKAGLLSMAAAYFAKVPIRIHTFTGLIFPTKSGFMQKLLIAMDKLICKFSTNIYPEGLGVKKDLLSFDITNKPLKILANGNVNGIDTTFYNSENFSEYQNSVLRNTLGINVNDFIFIFVGRLVGDKGINELISAFSKLQLENETTRRSFQQNEGRAIKLILVGALETEFDPLRNSTLQKMEKDPNVISVGFQKDIRPYMAISHCLVFPSFREGFPNVVLQAGAMGLPSIVTNINGCNEIIEDGQNGTIIRVKNVDDLFNAMKSMFSDLNFLKRLQQNARSMIVSRYKQQLVWDAILEEYRRLEQSVGKLKIL